MSDYTLFYENEYVLSRAGCSYFFCRLKGEKILLKKIIIKQKEKSVWLCSYTDVLTNNILKHFGNSHVVWKIEGSCVVFCSYFDPI